jgi:hypothetical protein
VLGLSSARPKADSHAEISGCESLFTESSLASIGSSTKTVSLTFGVVDATAVE